MINQDSVKFHGSLINTSARISQDKPKIEQRLTMINEDYPVNPNKYPVQGVLTLFKNKMGGA